MIPLTPCWSPDPSRGGPLGRASARRSRRPWPVAPGRGEGKSAGPPHGPALPAREVKLLAEPPGHVEPDGTFTGYASLFGRADLGGDVVAPGAFADSLRRRGPAGVRLLWQHDPAEPIGRWVELAEDSRGLRVRGELNLAVARAREVHALMRQGAVDGLSIGYRVERARAERATGLRRLEKLDLWEISVVTFPMLPDARVGGVKLRPSRGVAAEAARLAAAIRRSAHRLRG